MIPPILNPRDFKYLTPSDREYLYTIEKLYLLDSGRLKHYPMLGPWHQVTSSKLNKIVNRVATHNPRPCSKGHVKGMWCVEYPERFLGQKILKYQGPHNSSLQNSQSSRAQSAPSVSRRVRMEPTPVNKYSIPRKYQVVAKPKPLIIPEPSHKKYFIDQDPPDPSYRVQSACPVLPKHNRVTRK